MKADRYLAPHYAYYVREIKVYFALQKIASAKNDKRCKIVFLQVKAYAQLLESYRSLTLAYMAGRKL